MTPPIVVILGAGRPFSGTGPSALIQTSGDKRVLDWLLDAFDQALSNPEFHFVGGYRMDEIVDAYPEIHFSQNENWEQTGTVASLFTAPFTSDRPVYVCYADTIFEGTAVDALDEATSVAVDRGWQTRYRSRSDESLERAEKVQIEEGRLVDAGTELDAADAEFTGLMRLSSAAAARARTLWSRGRWASTADLPDLIRTLAATDVTVETVDIDGHWAELETAADISRFVLDTKANTLRRLKSMVERSTVLDQETFTVAEWQADSDAVLADVRGAFDGATVIVRSSALSEDGFEESNAGRFESVLDVPSGDDVALNEAIETVVDSYADDDPDNQVLVQPMIADVDQSGVVMTRSLETGSPYYVINYDATTASTESVTDGTGEHLQTAIVRKDLTHSEGLGLTEADPQSAQYPSNLHLEPLLEAVGELEEIIGHDSLDVEFAIDGDGNIYLLQARPMTLDPAETTVDDKAVFDTVEQARDELVDSQTSPPFILGNRTVYGVMPDWNPAEIIGRRPRQLATSLYRHLVMDETWAKQRAEYGYRDVRPQPLMKCFAGQPYVDVRADFNSFIPATVPDDLAERLVDYYLDRLESNPELHDKVEFEIVLTCLTFDYEREIEPLLEAGFTEDELEPLCAGLREVTQGAFRRIDDDLQNIEQLAARYERFADADIPPLEAAYYLLEDCRRLGTLPFAHLARTAFVATSLLRSLGHLGVLTESQRIAFQNSLNTVARQFERDGYRVAIGEMAWETFVDIYGHLRPGTYEITSLAYRQNPEKYLRPVVKGATGPEIRPDPVEVWDEATKHDIERELERIGLPANVDRFVEFLVDAIEGREHAKFVFSRNLSEALERIATFGADHGLSREDLSYIGFESFIELAIDHPPSDIESWLEERVRAGRERYAITRSVELPPLLFDETDFLVFERPAREPNFVTNATVTAETVELTADAAEADAVDGKIVLIPQADPGYDWLFGHDIAGLVTMYGGANSHMAVRAAEFSLPAAIGVGENRYEQLRRGDALELDCGSLSVRVVQ